MLAPSKIHSRCGLALYQDKGHLIEWVWHHVYRVPSYSNPAVYTVWLAPKPYCSCPGHRSREARAARCKYITAAEIFAAKKRAARVYLGRLSLG